MAGDGEQEIVVVGRELGELILEQLRGFDRVLAFGRNAGLSSFREDLVGYRAEPALEECSDDVDIVQVLLFEKVDVDFCKTRD